MFPSPWPLQEVTNSIVVSLVVQNMDKEGEEDFIQLSLVELEVNEVASSFRLKYPSNRMSRHVY